MQRASRAIGHHATPRMVLQPLASPCFNHVAASSFGRWQPQRSPVPVARALPKEVDVVVVGAGIAGLSAALAVQERGLTTLLLEASDGVGGRVRTDVVDGFLLDRGFQIFLTGYPHAQEQLDYAALDLKPFYAGAFVRFDGAFHKVADPLRHLVDGLQSLANPIGSVLDKVRVGVLRLRCTLGSLDDMLARPETTTLQRLQDEGFSPAMIDRFFRPFLGGIFFSRELEVSSRLLEFVLRTLALGQNCLPAGGIGAVSEQMAAQLSAGTVATGMRAVGVRGEQGDAPARVAMYDGTVVAARRGVIVAVEGPEASRILGDALQAAPSKLGTPVGTCNLYFAAPAASIPPDAVLYLNGDGVGIVNNCCFPSTVSPSYAPEGQALVSISVLGTMGELSDAELQATVLAELDAWFGPSVGVTGWRHLRTYRIPFCQPAQAPPTDFCRPVALGSKLYVCGDHRDSATLDGALVSGRRAAAALLEGL